MSGNVDIPVPKNSLTPNWCMEFELFPSLSGRKCNKIGIKSRKIDDRNLNSAYGDGVGFVHKNKTIKKLFLIEQLTRSGEVTFAVYSHIT